jgi:helicase required for RNAi-mediated heterochromatin assembly 1
MRPGIRHRGYRAPEQIKPVNHEIRQYFDPNLQVHDTSGAWQAKPELPSSEELLGTTESEDTVSLVANRIEGAWDSKDEYLKAHYALLREDSISPLRTAVAKLRADPWMMDTQDISVYEKVSAFTSDLYFKLRGSSTKVFITGIAAARSGLALHIQFSTRRAGKNIAWTYSNRLTPGAVVALTPKEDAFSSKCVPGVVACRLAENIEKDPPEVDIFLASPEDMEIDPQ